MNIDFHSDGEEDQSILGVVKFEREDPPAVIPEYDFDGDDTFKFSGWIRVIKLPLPSIFV
jgi:hypothetical protein